MPLKKCRSVLLFAALSALPACSSCDAKKEPTVVIVDDGGPQPRALRRPFDLAHRDSGIPRFQPRLMASSDASAPPIE